MADIDLAKQEDLDDHSSQHEEGGDDEISVEGLAGDLADEQDPKSHDNAAHTENYIPDTEKGADNGVASLDSNGELTSGQVPDLAITEVFTVDTEDELTTLDDAEIGDVGLVTGDGDDTEADSFILTGDYDTRDNWVRIQTPESPVQSVNGETGDVTLGPDDVEAASQTEFNSHASRHEEGGDDEISVDGLEGDLADEQDPKSHGNDRHTTNYASDSDFSNHSARHESGGADEISVGGLEGELADAQEPKSHDNAAHTENFANESDYQSHDHSGSNSEETDLNPDEVDVDSQLDLPVVTERADIPDGQTGIYYVEDEDQLTYRVS